MILIPLPEKIIPIYKITRASLTISNSLKVTGLFVSGGKVRREFFAKKDGGLHLNTQGTNRLRYYFLRTIASM